MLRTLNGVARKRGTRSISRFQLHQTLVKMLYRSRYGLFSLWSLRENKEEKKVDGIVEYV